MDKKELSKFKLKLFPIYKILLTKKIQTSR